MYMSRENALSGVKNMAKFAQIDLAPEVIERYVALRKTSLLNDQPLLAEVISRLSPQDLETFKRAYPQIFHIEQEVES